MSTGSERLANPTSCDSKIQSANAARPNVAEIVATAETLTANDRLRLIAAIWSSLPLSHSAAPSGEARSQLQSLIDDYESGRIHEFPWPGVSHLIAGIPQGTSKAVYSVPRRFDLSTIFVVTLAYSLLFGAMSMMSLPPAASLSIGGFISVVAVAQALLFKGKKPRGASIVAGSVIFGFAALAIWIANGQRIYYPSFFVIMGGYTVIGGGILGYLSGTLIGGIFLIADKLRSRYSARRSNSSNNKSEGDMDVSSGGDSPWAT